MTTREQIIKAAQKYWRRDQWNNEYFDAAGFADFVFEAGRVAEREACAKVCESTYPEYGGANPYCFETQSECAEAIRARGESK